MTGLLLSLRRIGAMIRRYVYLLKGSWPRILELAYWPTVQMVIWGFITLYFAQSSSVLANAAGLLISAVLLWDVMFRGQLGVSLSFFEEMWSRNLGHLFVSPLRPMELVAAMLSMSLIRTLIGIVPAALLAIPLYEVSVFELGPPLLAFFSLLLAMGWAVGLAVAALVLRLGMGAESLAWIAMFALAPLSGIYYPIETLPGWLHPVAYALPSAHVFEGMRAVLLEGRFDWGHFRWAVLLDAAYIGAAALLFRRNFELARRDGQLLQVGE